MIFGVDTIPEYRGKGYAGLLIENMIKTAKAENRKGLVLTCKDHLVKYYLHSYLYLFDFYYVKLIQFYIIYDFIHNLIKVFNIK